MGITSIECLQGMGTTSWSARRRRFLNNHCYYTGASIEIKFPHFADQKSRIRIFGPMLRLYWATYHLFFSCSSFSMLLTSPGLWSFSTSGHITSLCMPSSSTSLFSVLVIVLRACKGLTVAHVLALFWEVVRTSRGGGLSGEGRWRHWGVPLKIIERPSLSPMIFEYHMYINVL